MRAIWTLMQITKKSWRTCNNALFIERRSVWICDPTGYQNKKKSALNYIYMIDSSNPHIQNNKQTARNYLTSTASKTSFS